MECWNYTYFPLRKKSHSRSYTQCITGLCTVLFYTDMKLTWKIMRISEDYFFSYQKLDPWLFLFLWHCLCYIIFSFTLRHQHLINFEFLFKHRYLYLSLFLSYRNMKLVSFYGNTRRLRDRKAISAIFQSVVYHIFVCDFVLLLYTGIYEIPFPVFFTYRFLRPCTHKGWKNY